MLLRYHIVFVAAQQGREPQTISGGRRVRALSRWMVALLQGELGGRSRCRKRAKRCQRVKRWGSDRSYVPGEETDIQNTVKTCGLEGGYSKVV